MYLTKRQLEILNFIRQFIAANGVSPTLDEMGEHFHVSRITIHDHIKALEQKGALKRTPNRARSIELLGQDQAPPEPASNLMLPVLGLIQAGEPCYPFEAPEEFDFNSWIPAPNDHHLLQVTGESMIDEHIQEGDLVVVDRRKIPRDGDIVVAATPDGGVTLKRIYREEGRVRLQPSNKTMKPMYFATAEVRGVVVGLLRRRM